MAQRYEATELRHQQEIERRQVQDKARKAEKKSAHQKINARSFAKNYLEGIREEAMRELTGLGVLVKPQSRNMEEQVLPWLLDRVTDFLKEDEAATSGAANIVDAGFNDAQSIHKSVIQAKYDAIQKAKNDKIESEKQRQIRKV